LVAGGLVIDIARGIDIAVADAVGQRDVPDPPGRLRRCNGTGVNALGWQRRRRDHSAVVEQILRKWAMGLFQRAFDNGGAESARVDEQIRFESPPVARDQGAHIAPTVQLDRFNPRVDVLDPFAGAQFPQEGTDQVRVEMISVAYEEGEVWRGDRRKAVAGDARRHEESIGMRRNVAAGSPCARGVEESLLSEAVDGGGEGVEIAFVSRPIRPAGQFDSRLVSAVATPPPLAR